MWIEKTKNGKYKAVERYTDYITGKEKKVSVTIEKNTVKEKRVAQALLDEKIKKACEEETNELVQLQELIAYYLADQKLTVKLSTYYTAHSACNTLMRIFGNTTVISHMTAKYVRTQLLKTGDKVGTLNNRLKNLKSVIRWGYHNDYVEDTQFIDKLELFKDVPHRSKIQDKYLESEELKRLIKGLDNEVCKLLTEFLALSGLRVGEAIALHKSDIDYENQCIHVTKTYDVHNHVTTTPKTSSSVRDVYMQEELIHVCRKIYSFMLRQQVQCGYGKTNTFFANKKGCPLPYSSYSHYLREHSYKLIGRQITPHVLRHTHASLLMEKGVGIDSISRRLGHENDKITRDIYLHVTERLKDKDNSQIAQISIM